MKENDNRIDDEPRLVVILTVRDFKKTILDVLNENTHLKDPPPEKPQEFKNLVPRLVAAASTSVCPETLDKWVKIGIFPKPVKKGGRVYFYQSDLDSFNTKNKIS